MSEGIYVLVLVVVEVCDAGGFCCMSDRLCTDVKYV